MQSLGVSWPGGGVGTALYRLIQEYAHATPKGMVFAPFRSENMYKLCPYNMVGKRVWFSRELRECVSVFVILIPNE